MSDQHPLCDCHGALVADGARLCADGTGELVALLRLLIGEVLRADREPRRDGAGRILPGQAGRGVSTVWDTPSGETMHLPRALAESAAKLAVRASGSQARIKALHAEPPIPVDLRAVDDAGRIREVVGRYAAALSGVAVPLDAAWDVPTVAAWLIEQAPALRQQEWAGAMLAELGRVVRRAERAVDAAPVRRYLGICGVVLWCPQEGTEGPSGPPCAGQVFATEGALRGRCRGCGALHDVAEMQARREGQLRGVRLTAVEIERVTTELGRRVPRTSINRWAETGRVLGDGATPPRFAYDEVCRVATEVAQAAAERVGRKGRRRVRAHVA